MCSPFDPNVGFSAASLVALSSAALVRRGRSVFADQRGFTPTEGVIWSLIFLAIASVIFAITHCYPKQLTPGNGPMPLPPGAIQIGRPAPRGTRSPACEEGVVCDRPGHRCGFGSVCTVTYTWNAAVTPGRWQCACACLSVPS